MTQQSTNTSQVLLQLISDAMSLLQSNSYKKAEDLYAQALDLSCSLNGENSPITIRTLEYLARSCFLQKSEDKILLATAMYERIVLLKDEERMKASVKNLEVSSGTKKKLNAELPLDVSLANIYSDLGECYTFVGSEEEALVMKSRSEKIVLAMKEEMENGGGEEEEESSDDDEGDEDGENGGDEGNTTTHK